MKLHDLYRYIDDFTRKIRDEYTTRVFLGVPYGRAKYYSDPKAFFGAQAWNAFPTNGQFEMEEACRSFALGRSTAAVFHIMRLLEAAIGAIRSSLNLAPPIKAAERNWGVILKKIKDELDVRNDKRGKGWGNPLDRSFFDEVYLLLSAVRDTWRNPTMHVENKYTEEEAENILGTARAFVRKVASRMDEGGEPKA
jgi:HEPN domain-containing protein